jgi:hypothetical protein
MRDLKSSFCFDKRLHSSFWRAGAGRCAEEVCISDHHKEQIVLVAGPKVSRIGDFKRYDNNRYILSLHFPVRVLS